ncbi:MAG: hypothetical protein HYY46_17500 [Deltaproteobacteria bacterium]|nr:hypothetical protein [Deltaproteobacteria bacterium]
MTLDFRSLSRNSPPRYRKIERENGNEGLPIILLANSADTTTLSQVLAMGADDRLYKPIPVNILETRVKSLLEREKARRQSPPPFSSPTKGGGGVIPAAS